mmetsp:Transcript_11098/g.21416  ORF Transcript_11098/g.21416 Transcript_11098/m.21416 type:complete len:269 (-) Transcript_11098:681-1487(-)
MLRLPALIIGKLYNLHGDNGHTSLMLRIGESHPQKGIPLLLAPSPCIPDRTPTPTPSHMSAAAHAGASINHCSDCTLLNSQGPFIIHTPLEASRKISLDGDSGASLSLFTPREETGTSILPLLDVSDEALTPTPRPRDPPKTSSDSPTSPSRSHRQRDSPNPPTAAQTESTTRVEALLDVADAPPPPLALSAALCALAMSCAETENLETLRAPGRILTRLLPRTGPLRAVSLASVSLSPLLPLEEPLFPSLSFPLSPSPKKEDPTRAE